MSCQLIMIEGIPGAGKTTTAKLIKSTLKELGVLSNIYIEGRLDHPADYDAVSYIKKRKFLDLVDNTLYTMDDFETYLKENKTHYLIEYGRILEDKVLDLPASLLSTLMKNDIYNQKQSVYEQLILRKWETYAERKRKSRSIDILECCFLQNPVTTLLGVHNASLDEMDSFVGKIADYIDTLDPILIYLNQDDEHIKKSFDHVIKERSKKWFDFVVNYVTTQGYGLDNNLKGYKGLIAFYREMSAIQNKLLNRLSMNTLVINNPSDDWDHSIQLIKNHIKKSLFKK